MTTETTTTEWVSIDGRERLHLVKVDPFGAVSVVCGRVNLDGSNTIEESSVGVECRSCLASMFKTRRKRDERARSTVARLTGAQVREFLRCETGCRIDYDANVFRLCSPHRRDTS